RNRETPRSDSGRERRRAAGDGKPRVAGGIPTGVVLTEDRGESDSSHVRGYRGHRGPRIHQDRRVERLSLAGFGRHSCRPEFPLRTGSQEWGAGGHALFATGTFPPSGIRRADAVTPPHLRAYDSVLETIGWTPLIRLARIGGGIRTPIYGKAEYAHPGGWVKDPIGLAIIEDAERKGELKPGGTIVEGTSGNTGVGLAIAAALKGY